MWRKLFQSLSDSSLYPNFRPFNYVYKLSILCLSVLKEDEKLANIMWCLVFSPSNYGLLWSINANLVNLIFREEDDRLLLLILASSFIIISMMIVIGKSVFG